ncbi:MAG: GatB/YqeY domain-containing protein [Patescibacteria group bacterium]
MSIVDDIKNDMVGAMKANEGVKTSTLRLLMSEVKNKQIELGRELSDEEVTGVIVKSAKQRKESIDAYDKAGRDDLASREKEEFAILSKYLPAQMGEDEVRKVVDEVIASMSLPANANVGQVMGVIMGKLKGRVDGGVVSEIVTARLKQINGSS